MQAERQSRDCKRPVSIMRREDGKAVITGYAAVFYNPADPGTEYALWNDLVERVAPGAFDRALREKHDARAFVNHDSNQILGRVSAGTCRLSVDAIGLKYEIDVPDTQAGRDVATSIERGDINGSSFGFVGTKTTYERGDSKDIRWVADVDLFDVGPVVWPAYGSTTASTRSDAGADRVGYEAWKSLQRSREIDVTLALLDLDE